MSQSIPPVGDTEGNQVGLVGGVVTENNRVQMNDDDLCKFYDEHNACIPISYAEFKGQVAEDADAQAAELMPQVRAINEAGAATASAILRIKICAKWKWLRIYIIIRI